MPSIASQTYLRNARWIPIVVLLLAGCARQENVYNINLQPRGQKIERRLTFSHGRDKVQISDRAELERIAKLYGVTPPDVPAKEVSFAGTFAGRLPTDVGGAGHFVRWDSPLGGVVLYIERFRGNDDIHTALEARRTAVDQLADLLVGWFESELRDVPSWPVLRRFLDKTLRNDLQNLSSYLWSLNIQPIVDSKGLSVEMGFRAAEYFVERGYASYDEAPSLARALEDANSRDEWARLLAKIRPLLVSRAGSPTDGPLAPRLVFLSDSQRCRDSWRRYFERTDYFNQRKEEVLRRIEKRHKEQRDRLALERRPSPKAAGQEAEELAREKRNVAEEILSDLVVNAVQSHLRKGFLEIFPADTNLLQLSLAAPREPFSTNGKWVAKDGRVAWSQAIGTAAHSDDLPNFDWPTICFAVWDEPNDEAQKRLLGTVDVTKTKLLEYCVWYQGLSSQEKQEWDVFVANLKRDGSSQDRLTAFRFSNEPASRETHQRVAGTGAGALLEAMKRPQH